MGLLHRGCATVWPSIEAEATRVAPLMGVSAHSPVPPFVLRQNKTEKMIMTEGAWPGLRIVGTVKLSSPPMLYQLCPSNGGKYE